MAAYFVLVWVRFLLMYRTVKWTVKGRLKLGFRRMGSW